MNTTEARPVQLTLLTDAAHRPLAESNERARFRLSEETRRLGLANIAEIRTKLAEAQARREAALSPALPSRSDLAA